MENVVRRTIVRKEVVIPKRKFNLVLGLKRCINDLNEYFGLESLTEKVWFYSFIGFMTLAFLFVIIPAQLQLS